MAHEKTGVSRVDNPAQRLGEVIRGVDNTGNVDHEDVAEGTPLLDAKVAHFNVTGAVGRAIMIDKFDGGVIVFVELRIGTVTKTLMPEKAFSGRSEAKKAKFVGVGLVLTKTATINTGPDVVRSLVGGSGSEATEFAETRHRISNLGAGRNGRWGRCREGSNGNAPRRRFGTGSDNWRCSLCFGQG